MELKRESIESYLIKNHKAEIDEWSKNYFQGKPSKDMDLKLDFMAL